MEIVGDFSWDLVFPALPINLAHMCHVVDFNLNFLIKTVEYKFLDQSSSAFLLSFF